MYLLIVLWKNPWHLRPLTIEVLGANWKSHGTGLEVSLVGFLQAFASILPWV